MKLRHVDHLPRAHSKRSPRWLPMCPIRTHLFLPGVCFSKRCHLKAFRGDWAEGAEGTMCRTSPLPLDSHSPNGGPGRVRKAGQEVEPSPGRAVGLQRQPGV